MTGRHNYCGSGGRTMARPEIFIQSIILANIDANFIVTIILTLAMNKVNQI